MGANATKMGDAPPDIVQTQFTLSKASADMERMESKDIELPFDHASATRKLATGHKALDMAANVDLETGDSPIHLLNAEKGSQLVTAVESPTVKPRTRPSSLPALHGNGASKLPPLQGALPPIGGSRKQPLGNSVFGNDTLGKVRWGGNRSSGSEKQNASFGVTETLGTGLPSQFSPKNQAGTSGFTVDSKKPPGIQPSEHESLMQPAQLSPTAHEKGVASYHPRKALASVTGNDDPSSSPLPPSKAIQSSAKVPRRVNFRRPSADSTQTTKARPESPKATVRKSATAMHANEFEDEQQNVSEQEKKRKSKRKWFRLKFSWKSFGLSNCARPELPVHSPAAEPEARRSRRTKTRNISSSRSVGGSSVDEFPDDSSYGTARDYSMASDIDTDHGEMPGGVGRGMRLKASLRSTVDLSVGMAQRAWAGAGSAEPTFLVVGEVHNPELLSGMMAFPGGYIGDVPVTAFVLTEPEKPPALAPASLSRWDSSGKLTGPPSQRSRGEDEDPEAIEAQDDEARAKVIYNMQQYLARNRATQYALWFEAYSGDYVEHDPLRSLVWPSVGSSEFDSIVIIASDTQRTVSRGFQCLLTAKGAVRFLPLHNSSIASSRGSASIDSDRSYYSYASDASYSNTEHTAIRMPADDGGRRRRSKQTSDTERENARFRKAALEGGFSDRYDAYGFADEF